MADSEGVSGSTQLISVYIAESKTKKKEEKGHTSSAVKRRNGDFKRRNGDFKSKCFTSRKRPLCVTRGDFITHTTRRVINNYGGTLFSAGVSAETIATPPVSATASSIKTADISLHVQYLPIY